MTDREPLVPCPLCDGSGRHWYGAPTGLQSCGRCNGSGQVLSTTLEPHSCPTCRGTGFVNDRACPVCDGDGFATALSYRPAPVPAPVPAPPLPNVFHLGMDLNEAIEKAEQIGDKGLCVIKTGVLDNGRPIMFVIAVGDGVDALHKTMSMGGHRILPDDQQPGADT